MGTPVYAFAPGVVKLFGEHAVVYGRPALAAAVSLGIHVEASRHPGDHVEIVPSGTHAEIGRVLLREGSMAAEPDAPSLRAAFRYVAHAVEVASREFGVRGGVRLAIRSDLPQGVGLATSAAVTAATLLALLGVAGHEPSREELARLTYRVEREVQGIASPMDSTVTCMGGTILIEPSGWTRARVGDMRLVLAIVPRTATTGDLVRRVRGLLEAHGDAVERVLDAIGAIVREAVRRVEEGDLEGVGRLMYMNHWLLSALGVGDGRADALVRSLGEAAYGAKISGAGGGGTVVILPRDVGAVMAIARALGFNAVEVDVDLQGARLM